MKRVLCFLCLFCLGKLTAAELPLDPYMSFRGKGVSPPRGAKVSLLLPASVMIGEEIPAVLLVKNNGDKPFKISVGGDYRATGYPQRMKVRVRDAALQPLRELPREAYGVGGGGLMFEPEIQPGESHKVEFPLECYVSFTRPGVYVVTAAHDLGWTVGAEHPHPVGRALLIVKEPTAEEAAAHVRRIFDWRPLEVPRTESDRLSLESKMEHKLCVLRQPVYLPALEEWAAAGSVAAVKGIGHVATPEATGVLIGLLKNAPPAVVEAALLQLRRRIPSMQDSHFFWSSRFQIDPLLPASWSLRFEQPVLDAVVKLLSHPETGLAENAASLLMLRGRAEHAPALVAALQAAMDDYRPPRTNAAPNSLDFPRPQQSFVNALDALRQRGWRAEKPGRTAPMVVWLRQLADEKIPRAEKGGWESHMLTWVTNGPTLLKVSALEAIPQPLSDEAVKAVGQALEGSDLHVMRVACAVAGKSRRPEFARPLTQIVELFHESFLQRSAHEAALACGARLELWEAWANVITDKERMYEAVRALIEGTLDLPGTNGSGNSNFTRDQRFVIREAWNEFLRQHSQQFSKGGKVPPPDGALAAKLTGAGFSPERPVTAVDFKDGSRWPPRAPGK
ncbi:MAG: hypothetical protein ACO1TE_02080 [Prosthecobacter sp.]